MKQFIHESTFIDDFVSIGDGTYIWHFCHVMNGASIGINCNIGQNVFIGKNVRIGDNVKIQNNVSVYEGVVLEDDVFCGPSAVFTNILTPRSAFPRNKPDDYVETIVKKGASIGANATIICGLKVGCYALVGAGAVVTKDIPDYGLVYGNPAALSGYICKCGSTKTGRDSELLKCNDCGTKKQINHLHGL